MLTLNANLAPYISYTAAPAATRLTDIFTPSFRKSDIPLRSHMTFCDQRSTQKVICLCIQNKRQSEFFF